MPRILLKLDGGIQNSFRAHASQGLITATGTELERKPAARLQFQTDHRLQILGRADNLVASRRQGPAQPHARPAAQGPAAADQGHFDFSRNRRVLADDVVVRGVVTAERATPRPTHATPRSVSTLDLSDAFHVLGGWRPSYAASSTSASATASPARQQDQTHGGQYLACGQRQTSSKANCSSPALRQPRSTSSPPANTDAAIGIAHHQPRIGTPRVALFSEPGCQNSREIPGCCSSAA